MIADESALGKYFKDNTLGWVGTEDLKNHGWEDNEELRAILRDLHAKSFIDMKEEVAGKMLFKYRDPYFDGGGGPTKKKVKRIVAPVSNAQEKRGADFEFATIDKIRQQCKDFVQQHKEGVSLQQIHEFVNSQSDITSRLPRHLSENDLSSIMQTLQLEEEAIRYVHNDVTYFRSNRPAWGYFNIYTSRMPSFLYRDESPVGLSVPCLRCPLKNDCRVGARINPESCEYISAWLGGSRSPTVVEDVAPVWTGLLASSIEGSGDETNADDIEDVAEIYRGRSRSR